MVSFVIAALLVGTHLLKIGLRAVGRSSNIFGQSWVETYTNFITHPIRNVLKNNVLRSLLTVLLWALIGLMVYALIEHVVLAFEQWLESNNEIYKSGNQSAIHHPQRQAIVARLLWRVLIGVLVVMLFIVIQPLTRRLLGNGTAILGKSAPRVAGIVTLDILGWMFVEHLYLVLLRWYMFRTRVFGEIIY